MMAQWNTTFHGVPQEAQHSHAVWNREVYEHLTRRQQQDFIMPPSIRLHRHPHCPNSCKIFCQTSSVLTCRNCTVCQCSWYWLLITPATIWSPIYPNLWVFSRIHIFHLYMAQTSVSTTVVYYLQSKLSTHQSANTKVHCTQNEKTEIIQLCQYWYP